MLRGPFATTIRRDTALHHCFELLHHCSNIVATKILVANISLINKEDQFQSNYWLKWCFPWSFRVTPFTRKNVLLGMEVVNANLTTIFLVKEELVFQNCTCKAKRASCTCQRAKNCTQLHVHKLIVFTSWSRYLSNWDRAIFVLSRLNLYRLWKLGAEILVPIRMMTHKTARK